MRITLRASAITIICAFAVSVGTAAPVVAAEDGGIVGNFLGALVNGAANAYANAARKQAWQKIDEDLKSCLADRFNISVDQLTKEVDCCPSRENKHVQACEQKVTEDRRRLRRQEQAQMEWQEVDEDVKSCLANQFNINIDQAVQEAARPSDTSWQIQACEKEIVDARIRLKQEEYVAEVRRKAEKASKEAAKAQRKAKHKKLVAKFGVEMARTIETGDIEFGMPKNAVIVARGKPDRREIVSQSDEIWFYGTKRVAFSNGEVTYVGH